MGSIDVSARSFDLDILIIGGGLSGCYALHTLRKLTPSPRIKLVEAASDFGGVWYYNRYPGARVDSEWPLYQFSIPEVWKSWDYKDRFPDHNQIRAYVKHLDDVLDLRRDAVFDTIVDHIEWNPDTKRWSTEAQNGKSFSSRHLIICSGSSYKLHYPDFNGLDTFKGTLLHSAAFPEEPVDMTGKRVGVVGTGATGVQIVQELAQHDCKLVNFIRTPNNALPMKQRSISPDDAEQMKNEFPDIFKKIRTTQGGFTYAPTEVFADLSDEERNKVLQKWWDAGGFAYIGSAFREYFVNEECNAYMYKFWADRVRARITDPEKREILAPMPQQKYFGMKRPSLEQHYYESLDRPNVTVIDVKKNPIRAITAKGVLTGDGTLHELDVLILATGFDALNGSQMALGLHDKHGVTLREKWSKGTETYLGLTIPDCPNVFMSYGPHGPTALGNAPPIIETAVDWIAAAIQKMEDEGIETIEPRSEEAKKWRQKIQDANNNTFMAKEDSWWMGANIPGKVREQLNYIGGLGNYSNEINPVLDDFKGFDLVQKTK